MQRPALLSTILDLSQNRVQSTQDTYANFLQLVEKSLKVSNDTNVKVVASGKYSLMPGPISPEDKPDDRNGALLYVFEYYARIQALYTLTSFHATDVANETMNLFELLTFLRDFKVLPRLLTKREVKDVWGLMAREWIQSGKGTLYQMDLETFKDLFVRLAVYAYSKPGMKSLLKKVKGGTLLASEMVSSLCKYLNLDDEVYIKAYVEDVGRKTQGELNYRAQGEDDAKRTADFHQDREMHRLHLRSGALKKNTGLKLASLAPAKPIIRRIKKVDFDSRLPPEMQLSLYPEYDIKLPDGYVISTENSDADAKKSSAEKNQPSEGSGGDNEVADGESDGENEEDGKVDKEGNKPARDADSDDEFEIPEDHVLTKHKRIYAMLKDYHPSLTKHLTKYLVKHTVPLQRNVFHSEGPFLDMGHLSPGVPCLLKVHVINKTPDEVFIDVMTRGFESENVKVTTFPKVMVPGLSRYVGVSFDVGHGTRSVIAFVDIHTYSKRYQRREMTSVPVFYKVGPVEPADKALPLCTVRTLSMLMRAYRVQPLDLRVDFSTKAGTWSGSPAKSLRYVRSENTCAGVTLGSRAMPSLGSSKSRSTPDLGSKGLLRSSLTASSSLTNIQLDPLFRPTTAP